MGYCLFESRYTVLYRDRQGWEAGLGAQGGGPRYSQLHPRYGQPGATTWPAGLRHGQLRVRVWPGWMSVSQYKALYRDRGEGLDG